MKTQTHPLSGLDPLLSIEDLAEYLGVPVTTIYDWRVDGKGPCGVRVGRHVKFIQSDVLAWIEAQREVRPARDRRRSRSLGSPWSSSKRQADRGSFVKL